MTVVSAAELLSAIVFAENGSVACKLTSIAYQILAELKISSCTTALICPVITNHIWCMKHLYENLMNENHFTALKNAEKV